MILRNEVCFLFVVGFLGHEHHDVILGWIQKGVLPERLYTAPVREGDVMATHSIARVLALKDSANQRFKVNDFVYCLTAGWRRYAVIKTDPSACLPVMYVSPFALLHR
jgi:NADPH-dependent curcumin reductase CurA